MPVSDSAGKTTGHLGSGIPQAEPLNVMTTVASEGAVTTLPIGLVQLVPVL